LKERGEKEAVPVKEKESDGRCGRGSEIARTGTGTIE